MSHRDLRQVSFADGLIINGLGEAGHPGSEKDIRSNKPDDAGRASFSV